MLFEIYDYLGEVIQQEINYNPKTVNGHRYSTQVIASYTNSIKKPWS